MNHHTSSKKYLTEFELSNQKYLENRRKFESKSSEKLTSRVMPKDIENSKIKANFVFIQDT
jgi:hypothetical protein